MGERKTIIVVVIMMTSYFVYRYYITSQMTENLIKNGGEEFVKFMETIKKKYRGEKYGF
jgi:hypothetical protein